MAIKYQTSAGSGGSSKLKGSAAVAKVSWSQRRRQEVADISKHWAFPRTRRLSHWEPILPQGRRLPDRRRSPSPPRPASTPPLMEETNSARRAAERREIRSRQEFSELGNASAVYAQAPQRVLGEGADGGSASARQGRRGAASPFGSPSTPAPAVTRPPAASAASQAKAAQRALTRERDLAVQGGAVEKKDITSSIEAGDVMFLSAEWLRNRQDYWKVSRCQDLPKEAFVHPDHAVWLYKRLGGLIILSYPWLSKTHPDPQGFHFHILQMYLRVHCEHFLSLPKPQAECFSDVGVFWDYASLPQSANTKCGERSQQERQALPRGVETVAYLYGGAMTVVVQLKLMPFAAFENMNRTPYDSRGWCYFEEITSSAMKSNYQLLNMALVSELLEDRYEWQLVASAAQADRRPPMHPEQLRQELVYKSFSHMADCEMIATKYAEYFFGHAASALEIGLPHQSHTVNARPWASKEVDCLVRALPAFSSCMKLNLRGRSLGDTGAEKLAKVLPSLKLSLDTLWINNCDIGNKGITALAPALSELKNLVDLKLHGSRFSSVGLRELCDVAFFPWSENKELTSGWERSYLQLTKLEDLTLPLELAKTAAAEAMERLVKTRTVQFSRLMIRWV